MAIKEQVYTIDKHDKTIVYLDVSTPTYSNKTAIIDIDDLELILSMGKWSYSNTTGYVVTQYKTKSSVTLHRTVMKAKGRFNFVDHINHNRLDNRKSNLRICTPAENNRNSSKSKNKSSKYRGVSYHKRDKRWRAKTTYNKKSVHIGSFKTEIEAAIAYNIWAKKHFKEFANLNKIDSKNILEGF
jgi:hypothetical protein